MGLYPTAAVVVHYGWGERRGNRYEKGVQLIVLFFSSKDATKSVVTTIRTLMLAL
jgi:hypothetical protein